jgi:hypothetical protein
VPLAEAEFLCAAHHAFAFHAAEFADFDFEIARQDRARQGERNFIAHLVILRATDDLGRLRLAALDLADAEAVGIRVLRGLEDLGNDDVRDVHPALDDLLDLDTGEGEEIDEFLRGGGQFNELAEPGE